MITTDDDVRGKERGVGQGVGRNRGEALFLFLFFFNVALRRGRNDVIASNIVTGQNRYPSGYNW